MIDDGVVLGIVKGETGLSPSLFHFQETPWPGSCQSVGAQIRFPTERRMPLTPSQRVTLLREISTRLSAENWSLIDATLKQFSLPWTDSWNGTLDAYVLRMTEDAPDQALIDLAQHVVFQFEQATPLRVDPQFWRKGMLRLFISHLATYKVFAADLQAELLSYGISSFVAHSDIEPTSEWQTQIETALASCEALVALLHEKFHESKWADQEIGFAMGRGGPGLHDPPGRDALRLHRQIPGFQRARQNREGAGPRTVRLVLQEQADAATDGRSPCGALRAERELRQRQVSHGAPRRAGDVGPLIL